MTTLTLPIRAYLPRKTKKDRMCALNINQYCNWPFHLKSDVKLVYKEIVRKYIQENNIVIPEPPFSLIYQLYVGTKRKVDSSNVTIMVDKYFLDALVQLEYLEDDCDIFIRTKVLLPSVYDNGNERVEIKITSKSIGLDLT